MLLLSFKKSINQRRLKVALLLRHNLSPQKHCHIMKKHFWLFAAILVFTTFTTACEKNQADSPENPELTTSEDALTAMNLFQDTEDEVDFQIETRDPADNCPTITITPNDGSFPRTITIDYGDVGCTGLHGRTRRGIIIVTLSDSLRIPGATRTVTFDNFFVDDAQIQGVKTLVNQGLNANGQPTVLRTVENASIIFPDGETISWNASHTITMIQGHNTLPVIDNVLQITGSASGINRQGNAYSAEITIPLIKRKNCPWIVSGQRTLNANNLSWSIDYGDGACDRIATMTLPNGNTRQVLIRRWWR